MGVSILWYAYPVMIRAVKCSKLHVRLPLGLCRTRDSGCIETYTWHSFMARKQIANT